MKEQDTYEKYASFLTSLDCIEPQSQQLTLQTLEATCEDSILYFALEWISASTPGSRRRP